MQAGGADVTLMRIRVFGRVRKCQRAFGRKTVPLAFNPASLLTLPLRFSGVGKVGVENQIEGKGYRPLRKFVTSTSS
jgi:hypothetical protein